MQRLTRVGPVMRGTCRTIERAGTDVELLDTVELAVSSWKTSGGAQRWLCLALKSGSHANLELFVPLEAFTGEMGISPNAPLVSDLLVE